MLVFIDPRRPTGFGESLSGTEAYFISVTTIEEWHAVEQHPTFAEMSPEQQEIVSRKFPICIERYKAIYSTSCR